MTQPSMARNAATADVVFSGVTTEVVFRLQNLPWDPFSCGIHIIQASAAFTVQVMGPLGVFGPYPQTDSDGVQGGGANDIVVIRGRWEQIKVLLAAGNVAVRGDWVIDAYQA